MPLSIDTPTTRHSLESAGLDIFRSGQHHARHTHARTTVRLIQGHVALPRHHGHVTGMTSGTKPVRNRSIGPRTQDRGLRPARMTASIQRPSFGSPEHARHRHLSDRHTCSKNEFQRVPLDRSDLVKFRLRYTRRVIKRSKSRPITPDSLGGSVAHQRPRTITALYPCVPALHREPPRAEDHTDPSPRLAA